MVCIQLKAKLSLAVIDLMCLTMIDPASNWFEIVELPLAKHHPGSSRKTQRRVGTNNKTQEAIG